MKLKITKQFFIAATFFNFFPAFVSIYSIAVRLTDIDYSDTVP